MGQQRHMAAIRKGIISTLPLTIVGSFFTILSNMPIPAVAHFLAPLSINIRYTFSFYCWYFVVIRHFWDSLFTGAVL